MFMKKSLFLMVQSPLYCYNNLKGDFDARVFKPSPLDPCMFYGRGMFELIYVDYVLFFGTDQDNIDEVIK